MEDRDLQPRSGVPLRHKVIALFIAAATFCLLWVWLSKKATESASAVLKFDPALAQNVDPGLMFARKPAIALADSILNDQTIAGLAKRAHLSSSTAASRIGEFRSGLELMQPSSRMLRVQFLGRDSGQSAANANAVAQALAAWTPSRVGMPVSAAHPQPVARPGAPAQRTTAEGQSRENQPVSAPSLPDHSLSDSLGEMSAQLAATNRDLDRLAGERYTGYSPDRNTRSEYAEFDQQRLLTTQVYAAEKKLDDLRVQHGADTDPGVKGQLTSIQQALYSILRSDDTFDHSAEANGFNAVGVSASQLRRERSKLNQAIGVIGKDRQAIERTETAHSASDGSSPAPSPSASAPPSAAQSSSSLQQHTLPADSGNSAPRQPSDHPLSMVRLASPTRPASQWLAILVGFVCGLLYLGSAAWARRRTESDEDYEEESTFPQRFITPTPPVDAPREYDRAADLSATQTEPVEVESTLRRRAPFAFGAAPDEGAAPRRDALFADDNDEASVGVREEPLIEARQSAALEERVEMADSVADRLRKIISQTSVDWMFEEGSQDAAGNPQQNRQQLSGSQDRP
ncbi:MAG: hypothetical protein ACRD3N_14830 [Terracidiphilus sp.]